MSVRASVHLDDFLMAFIPVTQEEYARFVRETNHRAAGDLRAAAGRQGRGQRTRAILRSAGEPYLWLDSEPPKDRGFG